jgi:nitrate/nitrite-specific signal transduction histidine kinase
LSELEINRLKEDLRVTINELSKTYEELSLLYRLTENFSGATVDELCDILIDEIQNQLNVNTIVVLLYDQTLKRLYTKKAVGRWQEDDKGIGKIKLFRDMLTRGKTTTICDVTGIDEMRSLGFRSVLLAPLMGKKNPVGLIVVADKIDENEFFSGDVKLLNTISSFAGLFM